jgi:DNA-binding transcriptional MerR regulator
MKSYAMTVNELARRADVAPHVVRYYTRLGLLQPGRHPDNGYRLFSARESKRLRFIRQAKSLGFSLSEIREILSDSAHGESPCPKVRDILKKRIQHTRKELEELFRLQERMEEALRRWERMPDGVPDGHTVCHLIESSASDCAQVTARL